MMCQFATTEMPGLLRCVVCNAEMASQYTPERTWRECGSQQTKDTKQSLRALFASGKLGDATAEVLSGIGLTKERWQAMTGGECGCAQRQEFLNQLGQAVHRAFGWSK
jgi:hypothetical protein